MNSRPESRTSCRYLPGLFHQFSCGAFAVEFHNQFGGRLSHFKWWIWSNKTRSSSSRSSSSAWSISTSRSHNKKIPQDSARFAIHFHADFDLETHKLSWYYWSNVLRSVWIMPQHSQSLAVTLSVVIFVRGQRHASPGDISRRECNCLSCFSPSAGWRARPLLEERHSLQMRTPADSGLDFGCQQVIDQSITLERCDCQRLSGQFFFLQDGEEEEEEENTIDENKLEKEKI